MCVTNTTRRSNAVALNPTQLALPSLMTQRLLGGYVPTQAPQKPNMQIPVADFGATLSSAPVEKPRPKRRRKPQKPGKTAKMNDRHFVVHNYHDHAEDPEDVEEAPVETDNQRRRGGVAVAFPVRLHAVLEQVEADGFGHVVSWQPHGRCFVVHKPKEFVSLVMPRYFRQTKLTSFQRQLNLYGFSRLTRGPDAGGYYHELFLRGKTGLCKKMIRTKVKGTKFKAASSPDQEPDFYSMPSIVSAPNSSDEEMSAQSGPSADQFPIVQPSFDPFPLPYASEPAPSAPTMFPMEMRNPYEVPPPQLSPTASDDVDRVLDEAVDELFMSGEDDNLADFLQDWDPNFGASLQDDSQLAFMLDKLLEE